MTYLINDATSQMMRYPAILGIDPDSNAWREATQEEIGAYLLDQAKSEKNGVLLTDFAAFENAGFKYQKSVYCLRQDGAFNVMLVDSCDSLMKGRYCFCDIDGVSHDFGCEEKFVFFKKALLAERNRIIRKRIAYKAQINACTTVAQVDAINIDFSQ